MTKTALPDHITRLYLDTNIFIYLLEGEPRFADPVADIMTEADARDITLVTSEFAICECLVGAHRRGDPDLIAQYEEFFEEAAQALEIIPADSGIMAQAPAIAGTLRLKILDALHVASALIAGCDGFLTNDAGIPSIDGQLEVVGL
jgi:predicted nucleic acid-binding protein